MYFKNRSFSLFGAIAVLTMATLCFQNCSNAKFSTTEAAMKNTASGGNDPTVALPTDSGNDPNAANGSSGGNDNSISNPNGSGNSPGSDGSVSSGNDSGNDTSIPSAPSAQTCNPDSIVPPNHTPAALCASATTVRLMAGQHFYVGDVSVAAQNNVLHVQISLLNSVLMSESHVVIASSPDLLQVAPGQFRYQKSYNPLSSLSVYDIPFSDLNLAVGQTVYARVHAVVGPAAGQEGVALCSQETAWAEGVKSGIGWSMYFPIIIAECP